MLGALRHTFSAPAAAAALSVTSVLGGASAHADPQQQVEATPASYTAVATSVPFTMDSQGDAIDWANRNDGIAVSVAYGTDPQGTPEQIVQILQNEFRQLGIENVSFHFRQNDTPATAVSYYFHQICWLRLRVMAAFFFFLIIAPVLFHPKRRPLISLKHLDSYRFHQVGCLATFDPFDFASCV